MERGWKKHPFIRGISVRVVTPAIRKLEELEEKERAEKQAKKTAEHEAARQARYLEPIPEMNWKEVLKLVQVSRRNASILKRDDYVTRTRGSDVATARFYIHVARKKKSEKFEVVVRRRWNRPHVIEAYITE